MYWPDDYIGQIVLGNNIDIMLQMPDACVDAVVTDPPYGLKFMGKKWDCDVPSVEQWKECFRVLKPGGHLLSFFGTRTYHRGVVNVEDAGFEIRDQLAWVYGSGFPKSLDVSKAIDKAAGVEQEVVNVNKSGSGAHRIKLDNRSEGDTEIGYMDGSGKTFNVTAPATLAARQWNGWGTALKPAHEPIVLARKPLIGTVAANVQEYGTGGINVDGCRIAIDPVSDSTQIRTMNRSQKAEKNGWGMNQNGCDVPQVVSLLGRFPANLIHDGSEEVVAMFPASNGQQGNVRGTEPSKTGGDGTNCYGEYGRIATPNRGDSGSAARFFYCAKASRSERGEGNNHPTVKPLTLMRYLCRLINPPQGIILDPWCGSGTTCLAAKQEGFQFIGIDNDSVSCDIARSRTTKECNNLTSESDGQISMF